MIWITYDKNNGTVLTKQIIEPNTTENTEKALIDFSFLPSQPLPLLRYINNNIEPNTEENIAKYLYGGYADKDMLFCHSILLDFKNDIGILNAEDTNEMLTLLGGALEYIRVGAPKLLKDLLQGTDTTEVFTQALKDKYINKIANYLIDYPR